MVQDPGGGDDEIGDIVVPACAIEMPAPIAPRAGGDLFPEPYELIDVVVSGHLLEVGLDLLPG